MRITRFFLMAASTLMFLFGCGGAGSGGAISGRVISPGDTTAPVYILAIKYENRGMVRKIETEKMPFTSVYVAAYTRLQRPGFYTIAGLEDGDYILWAWLDKNANGAVEHLNFAEPVGWYQSDSNLAMNKLTIANRSSLSGKDITLYQPTPFSTGDTRVAVGSGGGILKTIKGNKTLVLWGTGEERAKAMGRLVAPQILDWINFVLIENYARSADFYENKFLATVRKNLGGLAAYHNELQAVVDGMRASGTSLYSFRLQRDIAVDDLKGLNSFYTLPMTMLFGHFADMSMPSCSSAVVWGDRTDNSELGRGLIHGKNMDGENDLRKITVNDLLIVAVDPSESGLKRAVAVNWPGFIGMDMGMNESGLILAPHSAMSIPDWSATNMLDNDLIYRETLQKTATPQEAWDYWKNSGTVRVGGFNTAVSARYLTSMDYPSLTFETDSYGGEARDPVFMDPKDPFSILTTNTFYKYSGVNPTAVSLANGYRSSLQADDYRYWAMLNRLDDFTSKGKTIGTAEMIEILRAASRTKQYDGITEYSFIGYPDAMKFALAKEDLENKILEASYGT
ncbi:MAG: hypothetical protein C0390_08880, partial [Syntrophus sp. (in: bacteria)]|nr:hypothetical protein [Syntrophus sp. (in: bacteria)]